MSDKNNGGPAFPNELRNYTESDIIGFDNETIPRTGVANYSGMSLRDYFAAKAMHGLISAHDSSGTWTAIDMNEGIAKRAYQTADAMLAARKS